MDTGKLRLTCSLGLVLGLMRKSMDEVLHQCQPWEPVLMTAKTHANSANFGEYFRRFDTRVQFNANFQHQDYQAFSAIGVSFIDNTAVEVAISLGAPRDIEKFSSEDVVTGIFSSFLEELYGNGRYYEDETGGRIHAWKVNSDILLAFFSYLDPVAESSDSRLGINICDVKLHPVGQVLEQQYEEGIKL